MKKRWRVALDLSAGVFWLGAFVIAVVHGASWWQWIIAVIALIAGAMTMLTWRDLFHAQPPTQTGYPRSAVFWSVVGLYVFGVFFLALPSLLADPADAMNWVYLGFCLHGIQQYSCDADEWWRRRPSVRKSA
ncbi:hypothetical protein [Mycobacteroides saopaulense]|uniref:hypothetical protein n=1 Tax=Mycobacteroides saopaulense TaxID=1578165 RepID=UPI0013FD78D2|nr:hypothetical protein [Mycobacteroides saopaulense]